MRKQEKPAFARNIVARRKAKGFKSAKDFAVAARLPYPTVRDLEAGISEGWKETRDAIAKTLGCTVADLYKESAKIDPGKDFNSVADFFSNLSAAPPQVQKTVLTMVYGQSSYMAGLPDHVIQDAVALLKSLAALSEPP